MAYTCDNEHEQPQLAFVVTTVQDTGDTVALCPMCLMEWCYAFLAQSEPGVELLKSKMIEIAAEAKAAEAKPKRGGRKPTAPTEETGEDTETIAEATDTPDPE